MLQNENVSIQKQQCNSKTDQKVLLLSKAEDKAKKILSKTEKATLLEKAEEKVKTFLKPFFLRKLISKEMYKEIMRKCVEKVYEKSKIGGPVKDDKVAFLVQAYVTKLS